MTLFRTASAKDYSFNPESGFWELSFDSRPVRGTRCDDPEIGATQYNEARAKFKAKAKESVRPAQVYEFIELVKWAIDSGELAQREIVLDMLQAESEDRYSEIKQRALRIIQVILILLTTGPIRTLSDFEFLLNCAKSLSLQLKVLNSLRCVNYWSISHCLSLSESISESHPMVRDPVRAPVRDSERDNIYTFNIAFNTLGNRTVMIF